MSRIICCVVFVSLFILNAHVDAAVLCAKKTKTGDASGAVFIREVCKASEKPLDPVALGLQGPMGLQGPKGDKGDTGLRGLAGPGAVVKDANGVTLGIYTPPAFNSLASVLMNIEGTLLFTRLTSLGFPDFVDAYYTSQDCSGPVFVGSSFAPANSYFSNVLDGTIVGSFFYYVDPASLQTTITNSSRARIFSYVTPENCTSPEFFIPPHTCCRQISPVETPEMRPLNTLSVPDFVPPFHVEMQP